MVRYLDEYEEQCKRCKGECAIEGMSGSIVCNGFVPMTNGDRIRAMSDEELGEWIAYIHCPHYGDDDYPCDSCAECWTEWMKQEAT